MTQAYSLVHIVHIKMQLCYTVCSSPATVLCRGEIIIEQELPQPVRIFVVVVNDRDEVPVLAYRLQQLSGRALERIEVFPFRKDGECFFLFSRRRVTSAFAQCIKSEYCKIAVPSKL